MIKRLFMGLLGLIVLGGLALFFWPEKAYEVYDVPASFKAQVAKFQLPDMPSDWTWHSFSAEDGTKLRWGETGNRPRRLCL